jgi:hypothetical protein
VIDMSSLTESELLALCLTVAGADQPTPGVGRTVTPAECVDFLTTWRPSLDIIDLALAAAHHVTAEDEPPWEPYDPERAIAVLSEVRDRLAIILDDET